MGKSILEENRKITLSVGIQLDLISGDRSTVIEIEGSNLSVGNRKMDKKAKLERERKQLRRLETLVDSVYALVLVLIATQLPTPSEQQWAGGTINQFWASQGDDLIPVLIGLVLVTIYWLQNNTLFGNLVRTDTIHTSVSLVQIFFVLFYLYAVTLGTDPKLEENVDVLALQSITAALIGIAAVASWSYASKNRRLLSAEVTQQNARELQVNFLVEPITALITLPCAFLGMIVWQIAWLVYPLVALLLKRSLIT